MGTKQAYQVRWREEPNGPAAISEEVERSDFLSCWVVPTAHLSLSPSFSLSLSFRFSRWCVSLPTGDFEHNSIIKVKKRWFVLFTVVILLTQSIAFHHPRQSVRAVGVALRERLTSVS